MSTYFWLSRLAGLLCMIVLFNYSYVCIYGKAHYNIANATFFHLPMFWWFFVCTIVVHLKSSSEGEKCVPSNENIMKCCCIFFPFFGSCHIRPHFLTFSPAAATTHSSTKAKNSNFLWYLCLQQSPHTDAKSHWNCCNSSFSMQTVPISLWIDFFDDLWNIECLQYTRSYSCGFILK